MSTDDQVHPDADVWVAAIHAAHDDYEPLGSGVVLDDYRILTCAHVLEGMPEIDGVPVAWVAFPKAEENAAEERRQVTRVVFPDARAPIKDLAILLLAGPIPAGVTPAPLRCPRPTDLVGKRWWAFGFPRSDRFALGSTADGQVGGALAHGWIRLDTTSRFPVEHGFSGGGLWSPDYEAVVAIVGHADGAHGDGRAITLHQADQWFRDQELRHLAERTRATDAGPLALAAWGWSLAGDSEATRHWRPRARGVAIDSERGYRFRGRTAALRAISTWLDRDATDRRVLVVTGAPGAGKSAVLGRIVTTADAEAVAQLPASDTAICARAGSVACAVHAKGRTALEVATQIAKAASAAIPERLEDFAPALRSALEERASSRFNVIIDALDESATPAEARLVVSKVILPLAETCANVGAQVVVGSRRSDADGSLLAMFGDAAKLVDLDAPEFFAEEDLAAYAHATLQLAGDERKGNPYAADEIAAPVAARIAALSEGNFLVAGLTARTRGLYDETPVDPSTLKFSPKADDAMCEYLKRIPDMGGVSAEALLLPLAYAESPGLPVSLWRVALKELGFGDVDEHALRRFARSTAACFLVESSGDGGTAEFRLFHQALDDALLRSRAKFGEREDEQALTRAFVAVGQGTGWDRAPSYLLRSLPGHAARAGLMDDLLADDHYLLYADLLRVQPWAGRATSALGRQRARLLRRSPRDVITADAPNRAAIFSVTEALEGLPDAYARTTVRTPYRAVWASVPHGAEHSVLRGHDTAVRLVCALTIHGTTYLATTASGGTDVWIWDPATGTHVHTLTGHDDRVRAACTLRLDGTTCLATGGMDATVRIWDPATGDCFRTITGHNEGIRAACTLDLHGTTLLATGSTDGTTRIWDPATGDCLQTLIGHQDWVNAVCPLYIDGTTFLATAGDDGTVRIWDPATGDCLRTLTGHNDWVRAACPLDLHGTTLLATGGDDGTVRIWDPATGDSLRTLTCHGKFVFAVCTLDTEGTTLLATGSNDGTVEIWDPTSGDRLRTLTGHHGLVIAACALHLDGATYLATAGGDATVRIWDPATDTPLRTPIGHDGRVWSACTVDANGTALLATGGGDGTVRIWDPATGECLRTLTGHEEWVYTLCALTLTGTTLLIAGTPGAVWIWDPATGAHVRTLNHAKWGHAVCALHLDGATLLATAGDNSAVWIWDPATGDCIRTLAGPKEGLNAVCGLHLDGTTLLATANGDGIVRIWDPATGDCIQTSTHRDRWIQAICVLDLHGTTLLATGGYYRALIWDPATGDCIQTLTGHHGKLRAVCPLEFDGITLLATVGDVTVRIWDPATWACVLDIKTRDEALSAAYVDELLLVGTTTGVLAIRLDTEFLRQAVR
jgi:WD40 repeat protein